MNFMEKYLPNKKPIIMTKDQVRRFDQRAINELGIPGIVLMENVGRSCAELIKDKLADVENPKVCIFCGTGNNGGDGYVIARHLLNDGFNVDVAICGNRGKIKGDAKTNLDILEQISQPAKLLDPKDTDIPKHIEAFAHNTDMVVDSLFGTGLNGQLRDEYIKLIESINNQHKPILAVDIPSGLDCDSGQPLGAAIKAAYTVTFVAMKRGFTMAKAAADYTGQIYIASIGVVPN